jgi:methionyl-tRNA formyltransferase
MEQDNAAATRAPKLRKEEALLDWQLPAQALFNKIRAYKPFPGTYTFFAGNRLAIEWAEPVPDESQASPGEICAVSQEWFDVQCGTGCLRIKEVKPEGKRKMAVMDFCNGTNISQGMRLA